MAPINCFYIHNCNQNFKKFVFFEYFVLTNIEISNIIQIVARQMPVNLNADVAELADAQDLKSCGG